MRVHPDHPNKPRHKLVVKWDDPWLLDDIDDVIEGRLGMDTFERKYEETA